MLQNGPRRENSWRIEVSKKRDKKQNKGKQKRQ